MASSVSDRHNYHSAKKFYSHSIRSDSTDMTEDEDFHNFSNSSSFRTSTTNSSPVNMKAESSMEEQLLSAGFYSGASMSHKSHSNHVRRSMIQSPSMKNFSQDLYTNSNANPTAASQTALNSSKSETPTFGLTSSPSMKALESILNEKTSTKPSSNIETITEETDFFEEPALPFQLKQINQSEISVTSFHTAKSEGSQSDFTENQGLLAEEDFQDEDDVAETAYGLPSPGTIPVTKMGIISPHPQARNNSEGAEPAVQSNFKSMLLADEPLTTQHLQAPPINFSRRLSPNLEGRQIREPPSPKMYQEAQEKQLPQEPKPADAAPATTSKKNKRKSLVGFLKSRKSASSTDLLEGSKKADQERPTPKVTKSTPEVPLQSRGKSKSFSRIDALTSKPQKQEETTPPTLPKSRSKIFSAFKRRSAYADLPSQPPKEDQDKVKPLPKVAKEPKQSKQEVIEDPSVLREADLKKKGHEKRNSILVPSPLLDEHAFAREQESSTLLKDLSFSASMVSSINHNYDVLNYSGIEEEELDDEADEFNSSFNTIKQSYSNEDLARAEPQRSYLPRDISVGSLRLDFEDYSIDDYTSSPRMIPQVVADSPAKKAEHHKTSSKIQNLLGEALFPKSLDINEVTSITTLERSRSMKSVRSSTANSIRESALIDGMTVVRSPRSPRHEPNSNLLSSPSSILKRRSMDYDNELEEFANMIDFGDDDEDGDDREFHGRGIDANVAADDDYEFSFATGADGLDFNFDGESSQVSMKLEEPIQSLKPLPSIPSRETLQPTDDDEVVQLEPPQIVEPESEGVDDLHVDEEEEPQEDLDSEVENPFAKQTPFVRMDKPQRFSLEESTANPFDYPAHIKSEEVDDHETLVGLNIGRAVGTAKVDLGQEVQVKEEYNSGEDTFGGEDAEDNDYDGDDFSVKIKQEDDFDEDFNSYDYHPTPTRRPDPVIDSYAAASDREQPQRPISMSFRGLKGPKFGETDRLVANSSRSHSMYMTLPEDTSAPAALPASPSRLNLTEKILRNYYNNGASKKVSFSSRILLFDTYHEDDYDRHPEIATCNQLTPLLAQQIRQELNSVKSEMEVHEASQCYTHFYY